MKENGQSMVLGGCDREGKDAFSDFSKPCMEASLELNLIVRVWGWSGHFTELERKYQEHIIKRTEFTM